MYYWDEEFYYEPSEFDMMISEFKSSLIKSVKDEFKQKMEQLQKENKELQEVKKNFEAIKVEYDNKKYELHREYEILKSNVRRERLKELMKDLEVEMWTVAYNSLKQQKCDKCDENRRIYYTKPSGKSDYEMCECNSSVHFYEPIPIMLHNFRINSGNGQAWYKVKLDSSWGDHLEYETDSIYQDKLVKSEEQFEKVWYGNALFNDKDMAQKYCDYKNKGVKPISNNSQSAKRKSK